jgi:serine/threonine protein kinase
VTDSTTGSVVAGYRLGRQLGHGGDAIVCEAVDLELGRRVPLKLIAPEHSRDAGFRDRFVAESRLNQILSFASDDEQPPRSSTPPCCRSTVRRSR